MNFDFYFLMTESWFLKNNRRTSPGQSTTHPLKDLYTAVVTELVLSLRI